MHDLTGPFDFFLQHQQISANFSIIAFYDSDILYTIQAEVRFHSFIHSFIFFIFFYLLRGLWLRFLRMLLLQRMSCTWIRGHIFLAASMRFSGPFLCAKNWGQHSAGNDAGREKLQEVRFFHLLGSLKHVVRRRRKVKRARSLGGLPLKCWIGMDQGQATFTFLAWPQWNADLSGKGKASRWWPFLEYFHVFSWRVVGVGSGQPWFSNSLRRTSQKRPRKGQREGQSKLSVLDERSDWLKSFVWNCIPLDHTWLKCMILQDPLFFNNINKYQQTSASLLSTIRIFFTLSRQKFRIMAGPGPNLRIVGSWIMQDFLMTRFVVWCFVVPSGLRNTAGPTIRLHCMGFMWYLWYLLMPSFWSCFSRYRDVILSVTCEMGRSKHNFVWSIYMSMRALSPGGNGPHGTAGMRIGRMASTVRRLRTLEELWNLSRVRMSPYFV